MSKGIGLENKDFHQEEAEMIALEFTNYLNEFHARGIQNDDSVLVQLYKDYIEMIPNVPKPNFKGNHFFRSSSTGACAREHYCRLKRMKADPRGNILPQTTRWQNLGTRIGDMIQFDLLLAEKHTKNPKFKFEKVEKEIPDFQNNLWKKSFPHFEEFSTVTKFIEHKGKTFCIHGSTDGIMVYTRPDGSTVRVGLEIKSKQTSYSKTTHHTMRSVDTKHKKQTIAYSLMFDVDYWIVLYVNASKKSWSPSDEDLQKCPDIRAFGHYVTPQMKDEVKDRFAMICEAVDTNTPPPLELNNYTFNNYKDACAKSLTKAELLELCDYTESEEVMGLPQWLRSGMESSLADIMARRTKGLWQGGSK